MDGVCGFLPVIRQQGNKPCDAVMLDWNGVLAKWKIECYFKDFDLIFDLFVIILACKL